ncbi:hypothetical protein [Glutamicibacter sp. M10]|uniref:hypothetical protein n=1 Tax=Glutamicibacter sp. M10 TaxID=3023076 RepID=UPI0021C66493|nr:hypothetical protein [Glutamicibacter sp. M10]UXN31836.1 hypothetical protein N6V40_16305 [Glutamicibacter sp. M10]
MGKTAEALAETGARSLWREVLLVLLTVLLCLLGGMFHADDTVGAPPLLAYLLAAVGAGIALARHRFAVWAWVAATGCAVLVPLEILLTPLVIAPLVLVSYTLISRGHRFGWWLVVAGALSALLAFTGAGSWEDSSRLGTVVAAPLMAGVLGRSARDRRAYLFRFNSGLVGPKKPGTPRHAARSPRSVCGSPVNSMILWRTKSPWPMRRPQWPNGSSIPSPIRRG